MGFITIEYLKSSSNVFIYRLYVLFGVQDIDNGLKQAHPEAVQDPRWNKQISFQLIVCRLKEKSSRAFLALFLSMIQEGCEMDSNLQ
jgi:hypothetical protein